MRIIAREEIAAAFRKEMARRRRLNPKLSGVVSSQFPEFIATRWLKFHGKLRCRRSISPLVVSYTSSQNTCGEDSSAR
jgi:hypothetical protein